MRNPCFSGQQRRPENYGLPFIANKQLFAAVMFALRMMREGKPAGLANWSAANYYDFPVQEVAHYTGLAAARVRERRRR